MSNRRELLLDAAVRVLGGGGARALTHRAVDAQAGVPVGSTANYFPTREALLEAIVVRVSDQEVAHFDELARTVRPTTPAELADVLAAVVRDATGPHRELTLARYAVLVESALHPAIRRRVAENGSRVGAWVATWLRLAGIDHPGHRHVIGDYVTGLVLHQLAVPRPEFDPTDAIADLLRSLAGQVDPPVHQAVARSVS